MVNPLAIKVLESFGCPIDGYRSKPWDEFAALGAPRLDFAFTVCDSAAGEACPVWPGQPMTAHWGIEDPAAVDGTPVQREAAFVTAFKHLRNRRAVTREPPRAQPLKMPPNSCQLSPLKAASCIWRIG
jgi:arsenate reductase (thioredoxin)